jgi:hypothetical protein
MMPNQNEKASPQSIQSYVESKEWIKKDNLSNKIAIFENPKFENRQLQIPLTSELDDYETIVSRIAEKLASIENRSAARVLNDLRLSHMDAIHIRLDLENSDTVPFSMALQTIKCSKDALSSAACSVIKPQPHHVRVSKAEANQLVDKCQMAHTEKGSFIITLLCPIDAVDLSTEGDPVTFARKTVQLFMKSLQNLETLAREADDQATIPEYLSANFCKSIRTMLTVPMELSVDWATKLPQMDPALPSSIMLKPELVSNIERIEQRLRPSITMHKFEVFGTIESLEGEIGENGKRSGDVTLRFLIEEEILIARLKLNSEQYAEAVRAHMEGKTVRAKGQLNPGMQFRRITNITEFEIASK